MANKKYKLTDGNMWATDGIHDFGQNKTQRTINSEVNSALGGKAPTNHASTSTTYGKGTSSNYGHVKISDSLTDTTTAATGGVVPSMKAVSDLNGALNTEAAAIAGIENGIAYVEDSDIATRNYSRGNYVYIKAYNRLYEITAPVSANESMTGKVGIAVIGEDIKLLNDDINTPMTQYFPDLFWINGTPTISDAAFFYKKIGSNLLYLAGRFTLTSKNISTNNDSLSISLPNGYKVSIRTYAPLGSVYNSVSITNMVLLGLTNTTSIYIGVGAGGGYSSNQLVDGGIYSFSCLVPVTNS